MSATQTQAQAVRIPAGTYRTDPVHSSASFEVVHNEISTFRGQVKDFDATITASDEGSLAIEGVARIESIAVDEEGLYGHLLSPEFFDSDRYPEVRFRSTEVTEDGDGLAVRGELRIRDSVREVEARGRVGGLGVGPDGSERASLRLETTVDRTEFGLGWNMELPNGGVVLANDVRLVVELELVKE
jgi:polyisoprenoid-binding protein YceI